MIHVAILIFEDVEILDFAGPLEVFTAVGDWAGGTARFHAYTVAETSAALTTHGGLIVTPSYTLDTCPAPDVVVVPGGAGSRQVMRNQHVIDWLLAQNQRTQLTTSVCTGALVLGAAGLLDGLRSTTHWEAYDLVARVAPRTEVVRGVRYVDAGRIITSAGVQAGMDMALHIVARLTDLETARQTAHYIEYDWQPQITA